MRQIFRVNNVLECRVLDRINRFLVRIRVEDRICYAYINNTGRLRGYIGHNRKGFCIRFNEPKKTEYRLFAIEESGSGAIIDTMMQMKTLEAAIEKEYIPWLKGYRISKRNVRMGNSVLDYLLQRNGEELYVEVKSAVLRRKEYAMYPDCPSIRGRRHIKELIDHSTHGGSGAIIFIAAIPKVKFFKPYYEGDPEIYSLLSKARKAGVTIRSISIHYEGRGSTVFLDNPDLKVIL